MIQIKKTILTLVALLAVTTGAWAQGPWTSGDCTVTLSNGTLTVSGTGAMADYDNLSDLPWINNSGDITSVVVESGVTSVGMSAFCSFENMTSVTLPEGLTAINDMAFNGCSSLQSITLPEGLTAISSNAFSGCSSLQSITIPSTVTSIGSDAFYSCSEMTSVTLPEGLTAIGGTAFASCSSLTSITIPSTVTSIGNMAFIFCSVMSDVYIYAPSLTTYGADAFNYNATGRKIHVLSDAVDTYKAGWPAYAADIVGDLQPLASGPEVDWNKAEKTGSFTMPGGNVTLEPEYYPQAALAAAPSAIDDVPATTDGAIVKAGTVANIGETTTAQGTVMYYVSPTALDDAALLALAADAWTADVPTAESLAAGQAYVYYYVRGNDSNNDDENFSDGDILSANALTVTIAAEPTYAVTFADGVNPEPPAEPEWTASPNAGVKKGQQVTVTYTGSKKVIGVKAEKKARPEFVPSATIQDLSSFVEVKNNKDGTITLRMPTLNPSTYNVTNSTISNGEHTLHFGYEMGSGTNMSSIGANIITKSWSDHTPFSELDKTIDITSGMPRVAIMITGHVKSSTCPAPGKEHYWGLYRYTNPVKVTYNLGGGSVSGSTADKVEYLFSGDALATTFAAPTREGYTFDGWYTSAEGGTKLTASNATSATTIYAHWNAIAE